MRNLEILGVQEMSIIEQRSTEGGGLLKKLLRKFVVIDIALFFLELDYGQIAEDMQAGWEDAKN